MNESRPWWLWPTALALDAPAVAVTWQLFLASSAEVAVPPAAPAVLALVVWAVYLADRALDARRGADRHDRHRAAARHPAAWAATAGAALVLAAGLTVAALPRSYLAAGGAVAAVLTGYLAVVHVARANRLLGCGTKEASVGFVFAAGTAVPLLADAHAVADWLPGALAFAGLCWLNCLLISRWEEGPAGGPPAPLAVAAGGLAVGAALGAPPAVAGAVVASTAALAALHAAPGLSVRAARVLADVVLLSPLLVSVWP